MTQDKRDRLAELEAKAKAGGGEERIKQQHAAGKLTARERIDFLFDPGTFQELGLFVRHRSTNFGIDKVSFTADCVVSG